MAKYTQSFIEHQSARTEEILHAAEAWKLATQKAE